MAQHGPAVISATAHDGPAMATVMVRIGRGTIMAAVTATPARRGRTTTIVMADRPGHATISTAALGIIIVVVRRSLPGGITIDRTTAIHNLPGAIIAVQILVLAAVRSNLQVVAIGTEILTAAPHNSHGAVNIVAPSGSVTEGWVSDNAIAMHNVTVSDPATANSVAAPSPDLPIAMLAHRALALAQTPGIVTALTYRKSKLDWTSSITASTLCCTKSATCGTIRQKSKQPVYI